MKKKNIIVISIIILILLLVIIVSNLNKKEKIQDNKFRILTSFYPIYIMTLNITDGAQNIELSNMAENIVGCIHDYTLNTADLRKFEKADVFIENGKSLENFTDKIVSLYPDVHIIESAENVDKLIENEEINAHIWLNVDNYILQTSKIAEDLSKLNPENSEIYLKNSKNYIEQLNNLKQEFEEIKQKDNKKSICLNEALDYLLEELDIESQTINSDHEQSALSAEVIKSTIEKMKNENIKIIFVDKNDNTSTAKVLANETGAKIYTLNSGMNGDKNKDEYLKVMRENIQVLKNIEF